MYKNITTLIFEFLPTMQRHTPCFSFCVCVWMNISSSHCLITLSFAHTVSSTESVLSIHLLLQKSHPAFKTQIKCYFLYDSFLKPQQCEIGTYLIEDPNLLEQFQNICLFFALHYNYLYADFRLFNFKPFEERTSFLYMFIFQHLSCALHIGSI